MQILIFLILDRKRVNNSLKKATIYQYYDQNGKLSLWYRIVLLTAKKLKAKRN